MESIIGIVAGLACIVIGIMTGSGSLLSFWDAPSLFIVLGCSVASVVVSYPMNEVKNLISVIKNLFQKREYDLNKDIDMIIDIANIARREGLLALEDAVESMDDPFLKKGIMLIVDGSDPELIKNIMQTELYFLQERHQGGQSILEAFGSLAPAFGMVGTLIGLIIMLGNLDDPSKIGPGMATALVTTFYGVVFSNLVFNPMANKLKIYTGREFLQKQLLLEGMLSVQDGENPRIIKEKLTAFVSRSEAERHEQFANQGKPETDNVENI